MNGKKKELDDRGESGDTYFSMRDYCKVYRPKIVILENVVGAPWLDGDIKVKTGRKNTERGLDFLMGEVDYATKFVLLDTKDYYIPHTRQRGYMICVDKRLFSKKYFAALDSPIRLKRNLDKWETFVIGAKQPANVPASVMLLRSDDPLLDGPVGGSMIVPNRKIPDWKKCRIGHDDYRVHLGLGTGRPLTSWVNGGSCVVPDFWKRPMKGFSERVLDTIDIAHLRNLTRGFDDRYYK